MTASATSLVISAKKNTMPTSFTAKCIEAANRS